MYVEVRPSGQIIHCWKETLSAITKRLEVFSVIYPMSNGHMRARINIHLFFSCIFVFRSSNDLYASICRNLKRVSCTLLHLFFVRFHLRFKRALHSCTHKHIFISIFLLALLKRLAFLAYGYVYIQVCVSCDVKIENVHTPEQSTSFPILYLCTRAFNSNKWISQSEKSNGFALLYWTKHIHFVLALLFRFSHTIIYTLHCFHTMYSTIQWSFCSCFVHDLEPVM